MKVVNIGLSELFQLQNAQKTFLVLIIGEWNMRDYAVILASLEGRLRPRSYLVFTMMIRISSAEEEHIINRLNVQSLPSIALYKRGSLSIVRALSDGGGITDLMHASLANDKILEYYPQNNTTAFLNDYFRGNLGRLYLSGDRSSVGKSSMCLAILVSLLKRGVDPASLAYIKPVTQCEAEQPVTQFCNRVGIANRGIGPVVFYKGFTRSYLNGETGSAEELLQEAQAAVDEISQGKSFVLVDGVGYPSVGSICNLSNADVARKLRAPVLLIGKSGVGDAVDSYNLNSAFFEIKGVHILGGVFNKLALDGFYSLEACKAAVTQYFDQFKPHQRPYGFVPVLGSLPAATSATAETTASTSNGNAMEVSDGSSSVEMPTTESSEGGTVNTGEPDSSSLSRRYAFTPFEEAISAAFLQYVDLDRLLHDVWMYEVSAQASLGRVTL